MPERLHKPVEWLPDSTTPETDGLHICKMRDGSIEVLRFEWLFWDDVNDGPIAGWIPMWTTIDGKGPITGHSWTRHIHRL